MSGVKPATDGGRKPKTQRPQQHETTEKEGNCLFLLSLISGSVFFYIYLVILIKPHMQSETNNMLVFLSIV